MYILNYVIIYSSQTVLGCKSLLLNIIPHRIITWLIDVSREGSWDIRYHNHTVKTFSASAHCGRFIQQVIKTMLSVWDIFTYCDTAGKPFIFSFVRSMMLWGDIVDTFKGGKKPLSICILHVLKICLHLQFLPQA